MKRIITSILVFILTVALLAPLAVSAETSGDFEYTVVDGKVTITGYVGKGGAVTIPSEIDGHPVTAVGDAAFKNQTAITSVTVPNSVETIAYDAFKGCDSIEKVEIDMETVGFAFSRLPSLKTVVIGEHVKVIGPSAFEVTPSLTSVTIKGQVTEIGSSAFEQCSSLKSFTMPDTVETMGDSVFYKCTSLKEVKLSKSLKAVFDGNFSECTTLNEVEIPKSVTEIKEYAFYNCPALTTVYIPASVTKIGQLAFGYNPSLKTVNYGGTEADWKKITVEHGNDGLDSANIKYDQRSGSESKRIQSSENTLRIVWAVVACLIVVAAVIVGILVGVSEKKKKEERKAQRKSKH